MGITPINNIWKMGIVAKVLLDFLRDLSDGLSLSMEERERYKNKLPAEYAAWKRTKNARRAARRLFCAKFNANPRTVSQQEFSMGAIKFPKEYAAYKAATLAFRRANDAFYREVKLEQLREDVRRRDIKQGTRSWTR